MFNEDNFYLAYKVCEALNSHETMVKFDDWEVALHATELACLLENAKTISDFNEWMQSLYDNGEFKLLAKFIDLAIERIELNNR